MKSIVAALKNLGKKMNSESTVPVGKTIAAVINSITANFDINGADGADGANGADGADGADGVSVTAISLTTTEGAVTGGTCTFSDGSSAEITVTEATE